VTGLTWPDEKQSGQVKIPADHGATLSSWLEQYKNIYDEKCRSWHVLTSAFFVQIAVFEFIYDI